VLAVAPVSPSPPVSVAVGEASACAILRSSAVDCWGAGDHGQLGNGAISDSSNPVEVTGLTTASIVAVGANHACALLPTGYSASPGPFQYVPDGGVECWGDNSHGQLGDGTTSDSAVPVAVAGITDAVTISAGGDHTCAQLLSGEIDCWGDNSHGQLGDGTTTDSPTPVAVSGLGQVRGVATGEFHTCTTLVNDNGTPAGVSCWGDNSHGQLGDGTTTDSPTPVDVAGLTDAQGLVAAGSGTCAATPTDGPLCWGDNSHGQLGDGTTTDSSTPVAVAGTPQSGETDDLALGDASACTLAGPTISLTCWGDNSHGQLGDGTTTDSPTPVTVSGIAQVGQIALGGTESCAYTQPDSAVRCWGDNSHGQLGDGTTTNRSTPTLVTGLDP
jgi:alpha-tubulin suppressor-like RCC1 family protein